MTLALLAMVVAVSLPVLAIAEQAGAAPAPAPSIYSVEPETAPPGTKLTITGFGFSTSNTVHLGELIIPNVPIAWAVGITCLQGQARCHPGVNQALMVAVPADAKAGRYNLSVEAANGVSNVVAFTLIPQ